MSDPILIEISTKLGALASSIAGHEEHDQERHEQVCKRLDALEQRAERTGQHEAVALAASVDAKDRAALVEKIVFGAAGALVAVVGAVVSHFLGWK